MTRLHQFLLAACLFAFTSGCSAASFDAIDLDLGMGGRPTPAIRISGPIEPGDAAMFRKIIATRPKDVRSRLHLSLDSPGGNLQEAIALARVIREVGFWTLVEEQASCVSACFVLYSAGFLRFGQLPKLRFDSVVTSIGVHRALVDSSLMKTLEPAAAQAVVREAGRMSSSALREFDVPDEIIKLVQQTPAAGVRFLTVGQLSSFSSPNWLVDLAHARCDLGITRGNSTPEEGVKYFVKLSKCEATVLTDHRRKTFNF